MKNIILELVNSNKYDLIVFDLRSSQKTFLELETFSSIADALLLVVSIGKVGKILPVNAISL